MGRYLLGPAPADLPTYTYRTLDGRIIIDPIHADDAEHHATEDRGAELSAEGLGRANVRVRRVALASQRRCGW